MMKLIDPINLRTAIICSTLTERPLIIEQMHEKAEVPGIFDYEVKFLKLIERISNGAKVEISKSGSKVKYFPGIITNNNEVDFEFDCGNMRCLTYFLEPLIVLAIFGKNGLRINLKGLTNDDLDISVDNFMYSTISLVKKFSPDLDITLKINKRGFKPLGGGDVFFSCSTTKYLKAVDLTDFGKYKKVRGTAFGAKVSVQMLNRMTSSVREVMNDFAQDVWIYNDHNKGKGAETSPGYGIAIMAESLTGSLIIADEIFDSEQTQDENLPENLGRKCALRLLNELQYSGYTDSHNQAMILLLMALSEKTISKVKIGRLTAYSVEIIRVIRDFLGVTFRIDQDPTIQQDDEEDEDKSQDEYQDDKQKIKQQKQQKPSLMTFSCIGIGLSNLSRKLN